MEAKPAYIAVSIRTDFSQALLSVAIHCFAVALLLRIGGVSIVTILLGCVVLLSRLEYWGVLLQWPRETAISRVAVVHSGNWYLTGPDGFVHGARLVRVRSKSEKLYLVFTDNEWRRRCVVLTGRNCSASEKLRLTLHLDYLAALPGLNRRTSFWLHQ